MKSKAKAAKSAPSAALVVDPRIELIAVVEALSGKNPCAHGDVSAYLSRARAAFNPSHPAVLLFASMTQQDWRHRHPSLIMLDFGPPPALPVTSHPEHYSGKGQADAIARLLPALRDFAAQGFMDFFAGEKEFYDGILESVRPQFAQLDYERPLRDYLGLEIPHRYFYMMAPLYHGRAMHNLLVPGGPRGFDIYTLCGHGHVENGAPVLDFNVYEITLQSWHEVLHTVVDDITKTYRAQLEPLSPLYALMTGRAKSEYRGPQGWLHMVDEQIIRATTSRLAGVVFGEKAGGAALAREKSEGFALVGVVHQALLEYEASRVEYPSFKEFYPRIVAALSRLYAR